jgi:hypothetical protein
LVYGITPFIGCKCSLDNTIGHGKLLLDILPMHDLLKKERHENNNFHIFESSIT